MFKFAKSARMVCTAGLIGATVFGSVVMCAPLAASAEPAGTLTIANASVGRYKVYQLFAADNVVDGVISNASLNADNADVLISVLGEYGLNTSTLSADPVAKANAVADYLANTLADKQQEVANKIAVKLNSAGTVAQTVTPVDGVLTVTGLDAGYYLVMSDASDSTWGGAGTSMTSAMLIPLGTSGVSATAKIKVPTLEKFVKVDNGQWDKDFSDVADAGLIDGALTPVSYKLVGTMPANIAEYGSYKYMFTDVMPEGVTVTADEVKPGGSWKTKITCNGVDLSSAFDTSVSADGRTIAWSCADVKKALLDAGVTDLAAAKVEVSYTVVLDDADKAALYSAQSTLDKPQVNAAKLTFSNNPLAGGEGTTSDTPEDTTKLYSYNLVINKVKGSGDSATALTGAKFTLTAAGGKVAGKDITAADNGTFTFTGLGAGVEYTLTETTVPSDMKAIAPIKFTINATAQDGAVVKVEASENSDPSNAATFTASGSTITGTVVNVPGQSLFKTGAEGITFGVTVGGIALVLSVAAILKNRKDARSASEE